MLFMRTILWTLFLLLLAGAASPLRAEDPFSQSGVLLLKNGEMLSGVITAEGDRYLISLKHGEIRIRNDQVEAKFATTGDVYRHLRNKIKKPSVEASLDLARWCLRNGMVSEAVDEIEQARRLDPTHAGVRALAEQVLYRHASHAAGASDAAVDRPESKQDELRLLIDGLPEGSMETFTATIQPMLLNSCSTSACHGVRAGNSFKLYRAVAGNNQTTHMTQLNLRTTLRFVDRKNPAASRLLAMAAEPHSDTRANLLGGVTSASYRHLETWVRGLAAEPAAAAAQDQPASVGGQNTILSQSISSAARRPFDAVVPGQMEIEADEAPRGVHSPRRMPAAEAQRHATGVPEASEAHDPWRFQRSQSTNWRLPSAGQPSASTGRPTASTSSDRASKPAPAAEDPFDPDVFNRLYHGSSSAPAAGDDD